MKMYTETNYLHNKAIKGERWGSRSEASVSGLSTNPKEKTGGNSQYRNVNNHSVTNDTEPKSRNYQDLDFKERNEHIYTVPNSQRSSKLENCEVKKLGPSNVSGAAFPGETVASFQGVDNEAYQSDQYDQMKLVLVENSDQIPSTKPKKKKNKLFKILQKTDGNLSEVTEKSEDQGMKEREMDC